MEIRREHTMYMSYLIGLFKSYLFDGVLKSLVHYVA